MKADYIIRGGHVIDPASGINEVKDIYIKGMHIFEPQGKEVECNENHIINASGTIVTPGLIDFHTHLFRDGSTICIHPDMMIAQGTTAAVDAGSAGTSNYEAFFKSAVTHSLVKIKGFLTVYGGGQLDPKLCEDFNPSLYNIDRMERIIERYRDNILGLKIRLSKGVVPEETGTDYLKACVNLAEELNKKLGTSLRVCVHTTDSFVPAGELAKCLRAGDIFCHCFQGIGNTIVQDDGSIDPLVLEARARGVIFDAANGKNNFSIKTALLALNAGFAPDIISSDLTVDKFNMPPYAKNLPLIIAKYMEMGMSMISVIERMTSIPAGLMNMSGKIGTLAPGAYADISIFKLIDKEYIQKDSYDEPFVCRKLLIPQLTMIDGEIQYCQSDFYL